MSARTTVRTPRQRPFDPKPFDPGTLLIWESHRTGGDPERIGEVWSAGPQHGTRWVLDGTDYVLVKVGLSGRSAGRVEEIARHDSAWQQRMVRALDTLSRAAGIAASDHQEWRPLEEHPRGGWTYHWTRYHVTGCQHAERPVYCFELDVRHSDGTTTYADPAYGWHRALLAQLADNGAARLDLCGCITGEPVEEAAA